MLRKLLLVAALLTANRAQAGLPPVVITDPPVVAIPEALSPQEVERAIIATGLRDEWTVPEHTPGVVVLRYEHGYFATVAARYDAHAVTIDYRDSGQLGYEIRHGHPMIHPSYNRWVRALAHDLGERMRLAAAQH
jgi:hypothetical protein